jgi:hypothetical protein
MQSDTKLKRLLANSMYFYVHPLQKSLKQNKHDFDDILPTRLLSSGM